MDRRPGIFEKSFVILSLLYYCGSFLPQIEKHAGMIFDPAKQNPLSMAVSYPLYLIIILLISRRAGDAFLLLKKEKFVACMIIIAAVSSIWSDFPMLTLRRSIGLIFPTFFAIYLVLNYSEKERLGLIATALGIAGILSFIFAKFLPLYGLDSGAGYMVNAGAWRGIFEQKNELGNIMALSIVVFALLPVKGRKKQMARLGFVIFSFVLLLLSRSETSIMAIMIIAAMFPLLKSIRSPGPVRIFTYCFYTAIASVAAIWLYAGGMSSVFAAMGKNATFTGRTDIWTALTGFIKERPLLGYGYYAFWAGNIDFVQHEVGWRVLDPHSGYLQLLLDFGFLGMAIWLTGFLRTAKNAVSKIRRGKDSFLALWPSIFLLFLVIPNFFESRLIENNSIGWLIYVSIAISPYVSKRATECETICGAGGI